MPASFRLPRPVSPGAAALLLALLWAVAGAAVAQVAADHRDIEFPPLAEYEIPSPEVYELENGLRVFLLEDHELPLIEVSARIRTGSLWEPAEKTGLAGLMGSVQRTGGTRSMTGDEIDEFLEARAASIETGVSGSAGFASLDCLAEDFAEVLPLFVEILRYPAFAREKLDVAKVQVNSDIARRNDAVGGIASREFTRLVYGADSPLGRMREYATIAAVEREDLVAWHERFYHPNNIYLGVVGDFDSAAMKRRLEEALGDWPRGPVAELPEVPYRREQSGGVYFVEKEDVPQANVRLGHLGIRYGNPDYFAVEVMNEILGGGISGRLMNRIRSERGLAYSVSGGVGAGHVVPGLTRMGLQTKAETMAEAVDELYAEMRRMIDEPPDDREMTRAKDSILNSFIFNYASRGQVLSQQLLFAYFGLPPDFLETYRDRIEAVTAEDVARVAARYLKPYEATLLVVGRATDFDRPLSTFGEVTEIDISIPPPPVVEAALERSDATLTAGRAVLAEMAEAMGGGGAGAAVESSGEVVVTMNGQSMALRQRLLMVFPDRLRVVLESPMGAQTTVIVGGEGWVERGGQVQPLPAEQVADQLGDLGRDLSYLARYHDAAELEAVAAGSGKVDGTPCRLVAVAFRGAESRLCVSAEGLVLEQTYRDAHPFTRAPGSFVVRLSDYREVDGRQVPHRRETTIDGQPFATSTLDSYEVDPEVDPVLFERPAA